MALSAAVSASSSGGGPSARHAHRSVARTPSHHPGRAARSGRRCSSSCAARNSSSINSSYASTRFLVAGERTSPPPLSVRMGAAAIQRQVNATAPAYQSVAPCAPSAASRELAVCQSATKSSVRTRRFPAGIQAMSEGVTSIRAAWHLPARGASLCENAVSFTVAARGADAAPRGATRVRHRVRACVRREFAR